MRYTAYMCDWCGRRDLSKAEVDTKQERLVEKHFCNQSCQDEEELALEEYIKKQNEAEKGFEKVGFWNMECVKISERKQLDDLTYAQKIRDEERAEVKK
jgi:hypothetical protein